MSKTWPRDSNNNASGKPGAVQDTGAHSTYLYSFDARDKDEILPEVDALAARLNITHRRHFMYRSTEELQNAELLKAETS
jgi:hypothetical protein